MRTYNTCSIPRPKNESEHFYVTPWNFSQLCASNHILHAKVKSHSVIFLCYKLDSIVKDTRYELHCTGPQIVELWKKLVNDMDKWLRYCVTSLEIQLGIMSISILYWYIFYLSIFNNISECNWLGTICESNRTILIYSTSMLCID